MRGLIAALTLSSLSLACSTQAIRVPSVDAGRAVVGAETGIAVGRLQRVTPEGRAVSSGVGAAREVLRFVHVDSLQEYVLELGQDGASGDFCVELPAGSYRKVLAAGCLGSVTEPERYYLLTFEVRPGQVTYLGTLREQVARLEPHACPAFSIEDELDQFLERFSARYPGLAGDVKSGLILVKPVG